MIKQIGGVVNWLLDKVIHTRIREGDPFTQAKLDLAKFRIETYGWRGVLAGRLLADGVTVEVAEGNHRIEVLPKLGFKTVPIQLFECTDQEFHDLYANSNHKEDAQSTVWALNFVRHAYDIYADYFADHDPQITVQSEKDNYIGGIMGLREDDIKALFETNQALDSGLLVPDLAVKVGNISTVVVLWKRIKKAGVSQVSHAVQREVIVGLKGKSPSTADRYIREQIPVPEPCATPQEKSPKRGPSISAQVDKVRLALEKLNDAIYEEETPDAGDEVTQKMIDQCQRFIDNCLEAENEESNGETTQIEEEETDSSCDFQGQETFEADAGGVS